MTLDGLMDSVAEEAAKIPALAGRRVISERKGDAAAKLQADVAKCRFAVLVGWNGFRNKADGCRTCYGTVTVTASVFERPTVNRSFEGGGPTALGAAQEIARRLHLYTPKGGAPLVLREITPVAEVAPGVISCDVEFETTATL